MGAPTMKAALLLTLLALPHASPAHLAPSDKFAGLSHSELLARLAEARAIGQKWEAEIRSAQPAAVTPLDAAPKLGEAHGVKEKGFFSALQTSGSFTMMQAGGFEEEELGDAASTTTTSALGAYSDQKIKNDPNWGNAANAARVNSIRGTTYCTKALALPASCSSKACARQYCTECAQGAGIQIVRHKGMSGRCMKYKTATNVACAVLNQNKKASPTEANQICTKISEARSISKYSSTIAKKLKDIRKRGRAGKFVEVFVPKCLVRKEAICQSGKCTVKKQVRCKEICQLNRWFDTSTVPGTCKESYCTDAGQAACRDVARMA